MKILNIVKAMPRRQKQVIMLGIDLLLVPAALFLTLGLQQQGATATGELARAAPMLGLLMVLGMALSLLMGIPKIQLKAYDLSGIGRTAVFAMAMGFAAGGLGAAAGLGTCINPY